MTRKSLVFIIAALSVTITLVMLAQTSSQFPELDKNGKPLLPRPLPHLVYSPADLVHSGVTLPASIGGATTNTSLIRVGDATKMTVFVTCSQNFDLVMNATPQTIRANPAQISRSITVTPLPLPWHPARSRHMWPPSLRRRLPAVRSQLPSACRSWLSPSLRRMTLPPPAPAQTG
jgi:hypothetical protein